MNREGTLYEVVHFVAVVGLAYLALLAVNAAGFTDLRIELLVAGVVGVSYVLAVLYFDLAPPSWRGN